MNPKSTVLARNSRLENGGGDDVGTRLSREASAIAERRLRQMEKWELEQAKVPLQYVPIRCNRQRLLKSNTFSLRI